MVLQEYQVLDATCHRAGANPKLYRMRIFGQKNEVVAKVGLVLLEGELGLSCLRLFRG